MSAQPRLPAEFEVLQPFVAAWGKDTLAERDRARLESSPADRKLFYKVAGELAPRVMDYLDARVLAELTAGERKLMNLMRSLIHVALAVELQGDEEHIHAIGAHRMPITRGHADPVAAN